MGSYLNPGKEVFDKIVNSEIYVDKTGLLNYTNKVINTMQGYLCVSRPRRFGKSVAAYMLTAYYSRGCDSEKFSEHAGVSESECVHRGYDSAASEKCSLGSFRGISGFSLF